MEVEIEGGDAIMKKLQEMGAKALPLAGQGLHSFAEMIMSDSKGRFVPVDTGVLRASGTVGQPQIDRDGVEVKMGYGGAAEGYAVIQHEMMDYKHAVGGPKYLERPLLEHAKELAPWMMSVFKGWS